MIYVVRVIGTLLICATANLPFLAFWGMNGAWVPLFAALFVLLNVFPSVRNRRLAKRRYRICADGCELLVLFLISSTINVAVMLGTIPTLFHTDVWLWLRNLLVILLAEGILFWNGIIRVYCTSAQLGVKWRVIGILCGWIPLVNLIVLWQMLSIAYAEPLFESEKIRIDESRAEQRVCETKYPILLVHGVFFRDTEYFNYWGRIPAELEKNGARLYYGNHQSADAVADSGQEIAARIREVLKESGSEKVNIIAHSKGGLDCRYAISRLGMGQYVASLTTINTPHRGCIFADYLLGKIPEKMKMAVADTYNDTLRKLGDPNPDFIGAVTDLTASFCKKFNEEVPDVPGVCYRSVGSKMNMASGGRFPLNFSHHLVQAFDGENDGLVALDSFPWGESFELLTTKEERGITHGDMIDLNRENIRDFDVREFYVKQVQELKRRGF